MQYQSSQRLHACRGKIVLSFIANRKERKVEVYQEHYKEIDLVLSDIGLPGMTGAEIFKKLKQINPDVKVALASGYLDPDIKSKFFDIGVKGFIQKPNSPDEVPRKHGELLDTKSL